jgi:hypothetical protein
MHPASHATAGLAFVDLVRNMAFKQGFAWQGQDLIVACSHTERKKATS